MSYNKIHRFLLHLTISRGVISCDDAYEILVKEFDDAEEILIKDLVEKINEQIRPFQQKIKIVEDELSLRDTLVFVSMGYDDATKSQNMFTEIQLDFFKSILEQIMTTESRQITENNALNLRKTIPGKDAEALLITWCRMYYLEKIDKNYVLGIRAIHEFEQYIAEHLPDTVTPCNLCEKNVFRGYNCPGCEEAIHTNCLKKYTDKHHKWPCCKIAFNQAYLDRLNAQGASQTLRSTLAPEDSYRTLNSDSDTSENNETAYVASQAQKRKRRILS